jgi:4-carboxymuconolactone decarboxylase
MARIKYLDREAMSPQQAEVYDEAKELGGPVGGPYYAYIYTPEIFRQSQHLRHCMQQGPLTGREKQFVNIVIARHWDARYPWFAQVRGALQVGLDREIIDAVNARQKPALADPREAACYAVASEMLATHRISDATYRNAEKVLGLTDLIYTVTMVGQFSMTCTTANAFEIDPPADQPIPLTE